jgi:ankyrin repeat protein
MNNSINSNFPQDNLNKELLRAINSNDLDYMKYLLTSPELKVLADPTYNDNRCFEIACGAGNLEVLKYLINNPEVKFKISRKALITQGIHF